MMDIKGYSGVIGKQPDTDYISSVSAQDSTLLLAVNAQNGGETAEIMGRDIRNVFEDNPQISKNNLQKYLLGAERSSSDLSVTAVLLGEKQIGIANKGTNRLYQIKDGNIQLLTLDSKKQIEILTQRCSKHDALLLATEGFWKLLRPEEILIDYTKSDSAELWLSYLLTRIGLKLEEDSKCYSAIAVMFLEE